MLFEGIAVESYYSRDSGSRAQSRSPGASDGPRTYPSITERKKLGFSGQTPPPPPFSKISDSKALTGRGHQNFSF